MSDWMALWTRMNTFSAITLQMCYRYRQSLAHLTIPVRSRPISRPLQDGSTSHQGRPTRGGYRLLGSSLAPKQLHLKTGRLRATFCYLVWEDRCALGQRERRCRRGEGAHRFSL